MDENIERWALFFLPVVDDPRQFFLVPIKPSGFVDIKQYVARGNHRWAIKTVNRLGIEPEWCLYWTQENVVG